METAFVYITNIFHGELHFKLGRYEKKYWQTLNGVQDLLNILNNK